ncbi:MAG: lipopolysaccharide transport periplasmic protein LptA [Steroidobacteraceae bacterium]
MARSRRNRLWFLVLAAAGGLALAAPPQTAPPQATAMEAAAPLATAPRSGTQLGQEPISVEAASWQGDYKSNSFVLNQVVITQGTTRLQADRAHASGLSSGLDFANSHWTFDGNVRIDGERHGSLRSDQAVVEFRDNRIARATVTGKPATFEQQRGNPDQMARGHADQIVWDVGAGTVRLMDDAWLSDGQNEISGPLLVYNIREQRVEASGSPATGGGRVHIVITPQGSVVGKLEPSKPEPAKPQHPAPQPGAQPPPQPAPQSGPQPPATTPQSNSPK